MDEEQYRRRLTEVADWRIPKVSPDKDTPRRGRKSEEERYQSKHEKMFLELHQGINPSHPIQVEQIKSVSEICGDCGILCPQGRKKDFKYYKGKKRSAWREKCVECGLYKNPYTQRFELDSNKAQSAMNSYVAGSEESSFAKFNPGSTVEE